MKPMKTEVKIFCATGMLLIVAMTIHMLVQGEQLRPEYVQSRERALEVIKRQNGMVPPVEVTKSLTPVAAENGVVVHDKGGSFTMVPSTSNSPAPVVPVNPHLYK